MDNRSISHIHWGCADYVHLCVGIQPQKGKHDCRREVLQ